MNRNVNALYLKGPFKVYGLVLVLFGIIIAMAVYFNYPGYGTVSLPGEGKYTGELRGGMLHGKGIFESTATGIVYTGDFCYGRFDGEGKMTFYDGSFYEGGFSHGHMNGEGKMYYTDGRVIEGIWTNGVYQKQVSS